MIENDYSDVFDVEPPEGYVAEAKEEKSFDLSDDMLDTIMSGIDRVAPMFEEKMPVLSDGEGGIRPYIEYGDPPETYWEAGMPRPEPEPEPNEEPEQNEAPTAKGPHFLLKTKKVVARARNYSYGDGECDFDFSYDWNWNRKDFVDVPGDTKAPEFRRFARLFYDCIIPNAIIARDGGMKLTSTDACDAIFQGMRAGASADTVCRWEKYVEANGGGKWIRQYIQDAFDLYVNGKTRDGRRGKGYSLKSYVTKHMTKHCQSHVNSLKHFSRSSSPKLQLLLDEWRKNPDIGNWNYAQIRDRLGFSMNTISRFMKVLKSAKTGQ